MFDPTETITINSVEKVLKRLNQDNYGSHYFLREADGEYSMRIRNSSYVSKDRGVKVDRHNVEIIHTLYPVSPSTTPVIRKAYSVIENDFGDGAADLGKFGAGVFAFLTEATVLQLLDNES